ncbi:MAG TPA: hypothetical protein VKR38_04120 [Usitatibacter sp.]|nr:hypothetical protein [Usitatibacter sp.]
MKSGVTHTSRTHALDGPAYLVQLSLDPARFPRRNSFMPLVSKVAGLGRVDDIELALAPNGGGRLGFLMYGAGSLAHLRECLRKIVGDESIVSCRAHAA